jgi:cytochrome c553
MKHAHILFLLVLLGCSSRLTTPPPNQPSDQPASETPQNPGDLIPTIQLPLELVGAAGYSQTVHFDLTDTSGIDTLYLQTHRLAYRDASTKPTRAAKGSVRLNNGAWLELSNTTPGLKCHEHETAFGCLNGGYHTVRFTVPITGAVQGKNSLEFRFNGTDGFTSGYRVLDFNLRKGQQGSNLLNADAFSQDKPNQWTAPLNTPQDIEAGKRLWESKVLKESPLSNNTLQATCSSCHAADGRDLKYFNYSNWSITARSMFHGLNETEGKQIASYIRQLNVPAPAQARPWNPPYQPGPGLDSKPVEEWAAGAGLRWVLEKDEDTVTHLFPNGTGDAAMRSVINKDKTLNARETPVAIQFPDWNAWLPEVHPLDLWGSAFSNGDTNLAYNQLLQKLKTNRQGMIDDKTIISEVGNFIGSAKTVFGYRGGPTPCEHYELAKRSGNVKPSLMDQLPAGKTCEDGTQALNNWLAVKNWEVFHGYNLEDKTPALFAKGEKRSWPTQSRNVFEVAPHRSANNSDNFAFQNFLVGKYLSTAWYQLQVSLNTGNREAETLTPVDWNYQPDHIVNLHNRANGPANPVRYLVSHTKMFQAFADGKPMADTALSMRQIHIARYVPGQRAGILLDTLPQAIRVNAYEALLNATVDVFDQYKPSDWERAKTINSEGGTGRALEPVTYILTNKTIPRDNLDTICFEGDYANCWYSSIPYFKEIGVDSVTIKRLIDWGKSVWPAAENNWDALR